MAEDREPIDLEAMNRRRFDRFLNNIKEGKDYTFLSVYFYTINEADEIAAELRNNSTLQYLSMPNCYAGRRKIKPIMDSLIANKLNRLVYLDLNDNRLEDTGCFLVCEFLKQSKTVQSVALRANRLNGNGKHSGAQYLATVLSGNKFINRLDVGQNNFGAEGAAMIDAAMAANTTLQFLDLSANNLNAAGIIALNNCFLINKTIKYLRLQHNTIGTEGAEQLAYFLSQNLETNIEQLTLLDKYTRVLVLRGLMQRCRPNEITEEFLQKIMLKSDFYDKKIKTVRAEWEAAKEAGQELVKIPPEVFEYQEADAIRTFLKAALIEGLSSNKAVKMLMVGRARAGKTSLTNSLVNDESGLTKDDDNRATVSVEIRPWKVEDVTISVWDFAGQEEYYMTHTFFLSRRCVVVLIVDLAAYKDFEEDVYYWVKAIQAHVPGVAIFMVGTHIDQMAPEEIKQKCDEILIKFQEEERRVVAALSKQLETLEEANVGNFQDMTEEFNQKKPEDISAEEAKQLDMEYIEDANMERMNRNNNVVYLDSAQMARIREQRNRRPSILHNKVYAVSSKHMEGVPELREAIIGHATDEEVAIRLPNNYVQLLEKLKLFGEENPTTPIVSRSTVKDVVGDQVFDKFEDEDEIDHALELLHLVGQMLWYRGNNQLMDRVFVSPRWVVDITKALIRHDMFRTEHGNPGVLDKLDKPNNMKAKEFALMKQKFRKEAVFDMRFLAMLETWRDISDVNRYKLVSLLKEFDLIIPLPKRKKNSNDECLIPLYLKSTFHGRKEEDDKKKVLAGIHKNFRKSVLGLIGETLASKDFVMDKNRVTWRYDLTEYFPEGIFFRLLVRCYNLGRIKQIEEDLLYAKVGKDVKIVLKEDRKNSSITLAASHRKNLQSVWPALVLFASEFEDLLREAYKGVTCQVKCIAEDATLRDRALCNHDEHKDMVPPVEYMHVVWGNINAVQVGVLLRMNGISENVRKMIESSNAEEDATLESRIHFLGNDAFALLGRLLKNICDINDITVKHGRNVKSFVDAIKESQQFIQLLENPSESTWKGERFSNDELDAAIALYDIYKSTSAAQGELFFERSFVDDVVTLARKFMPDLNEKETEFEKSLANFVSTMGPAPNARLLKDRILVANDVLQKINEIKPAVEGVGENAELAYTVTKAKGK